jgi:fructose-1,6-bisphosphatase/inositol monophosphatase family enzyme
MELQVVEDVLPRAATAGACRLRTKLMAAADEGAIKSTVKATDGTSVTQIDLDVELTMGELLKRELDGQDVAAEGEEGTAIGVYEDAECVVLFDPTDGTALLRLLAAGSTTGCCLYDKRSRKFLAAAVADPWLQRVVYTIDGVTYQQRFDPASGALLGERTRCYASKKSFTDGGELLIEVAHGFSRQEFRGGKRPVLSQDEISRFWHECHAMLGTKVRMLSSNLMHQLLVAVGGDAVATVMTAIGGPWDMSGVALVRGAGGIVLYVRYGDDGRLVQTSDPLAADMVVCANSIDTARQVFSLLCSLRRPDRPWKAFDWLRKLVARLPLRR